MPTAGDACHAINAGPVRLTYELPLTGVPMMARRGKGATREYSLIGVHERVAFLTDAPGNPRATSDHPQTRPIGEGRDSCSVT